MVPFVIFSTVFLLLGFYSLINKVKAVKVFCYLIVLLPIGGVFSGLFIKSALAVYEFFYVGLCLSFILFSFQRKTYSLAFLIVLLLIPLLGVVGLSYGNEIEFILKDTKPFIVLTVVFVLIRLTKRAPVILTSFDIKILLALNLTKSIFIYILGNYYGLNTAISDDPFFVENEGFRYSDIGTLFVVFYFIYKLTHKIKFSLFDIACILIPVLVTQQRTLILTLIIILYVFYLFNGKFVSKITMLSIIPLSFYALFVLVGGRIFDIFDSDLLLKLLSIRFSPFINELVNFESTTDYFFGLGFGRPFYIPWFEYRENINNFNPNVDNLYLTYFLKFGASFILVLTLFYYVLQKNIQHKRYVRYLGLYLLILGATTAFSYQSAFLFLFLFPVLFSEQDKNDKINITLPPKVNQGTDD